MVLSRETIMAPPSYIHQKEDSWEKNTRTIKEKHQNPHPIEGNSRPRRQRPGTAVYLCPFLELSLAR